MKELIELYGEYIRLLGEELDELAPLAHIHGWKSTRFEQGEQLRERIRDCKLKMALFTEDGAMRYR